MVEARCQGVGRFALRIPDESIGTRALPTCPDRRQQVAQQSRQPYLGFRCLRLPLPHGSVGGWRRPTVVEVRTWGRGAMGPDSWAGRMWKCWVLVSGPGELAPEYWFTLRSAGIQAPDDRLLRHRIHADAGSAGPASLEPRSGQGDPVIWDALRSASLGRPSEPDHRLRVQVVVSLLPELPGDRTWEFGGWSPSQGMMGQPGESGDGTPSAGRLPTVVAVRPWVRRTEGYGNVGSSSADRGQPPPVRFPSAGVNQGMRAHPPPHSQGLERSR